MERWVRTDANASRNTKECHNTNAADIIFYAARSGDATDGTSGSTFSFSIWFHAIHQSTARISMEFFAGVECAVNASVAGFSHSADASDDAVAVPIVPLHFRNEYRFSSNSVFRDRREVLVIKNPQC